MVRRGPGLLVVSLMALAACSHDWSASDVADGDAAFPSEDGEGLLDTDGTTPEADGEAEFLAEADADDGSGADDGGDVAEDATPDGPSPECGDGVIGPGEECDDGNEDDTDACTTSCRSARCGDGSLWAEHEECDPGSGGPVAGCDTDCTFAACGDGVVGIVPGFLDDFESGVLAMPPWEIDDTYGFSPTVEYAYSGLYSLRSNNSGTRRSTSWVRVRAATGGTACFWYMGEPGREGDDSLVLRVDDQAVFEQQTGQLDWTQVCVDVEPGLRAFEWRYEKDGRPSLGTLDAFFLDDVDTGGPFVEECDDANDDNSDGCIDSCRTAFCGDEHVWADREECDGNSRNCSTGCGSIGREACGAACSWSGTCNEPVETCNGIDDDCDGSADEGYTCRAGTTRSCVNGCSRSGTQTCGASCTWGACCTSIEYCDCATCDDNCDGVTDEGCTPC